MTIFSKQRIGLPVSASFSLWMIALLCPVSSTAVERVDNQEADPNVESFQQEVITAEDQQVQDALEAEARFKGDEKDNAIVMDSPAADKQGANDTSENSEVADTADATVTEDEIAVMESETEQLKFNVWEFRVEGNNLLGRGEIERTVYPFLGPDKTIDTVEAARSSLEQTYRNNGYPTVFVDIPEQDVDNGIVTLVVTEGEVGRISITGSRYYSLGKIREQVPSLQEGNTPYMPRVQEELASLNKGVAGRTVTPVMRPGDTPGQLDVELKVEDEFPLHGSIDINDRFIANTSRLRLNATLRYDNLWQKGHSASLGYVVAPQDRNEVEVIFGTYVLRFPGSDNVLAVYAVNSDSDVASIGDINQIGSGRIFGMRGIIPLPALNRYTHNLTLGIDYKDFDESTLLAGQSVLVQPASYLSFVPSYTGNWFHEGGKTTLTLEAHLSPRGLGNTDSEFQNKRVGSEPNFAFFKSKLVHEQQLPYRMRMSARLEAQLADGPLIANEQYASGGVDTVRGYFEAQQLGDDGVTGSLELHSPSIAKSIFDYLNDMHFFAFVDAARLKVQEPLPDQLSRFTLASVGVGMDLAAFDGFNSQLLWAYVLRDNGDIDRGDSRVHFKVGYEF